MFVRLTCLFIIFSSAAYFASSCGHGKQGDAVEKVVSDTSKAESDFAKEFQGTLTKDEAALRAKARLRCRTPLVRLCLLRLGLPQHKKWNIAYALVPEVGFQSVKLVSRKSSFASDELNTCFEREINTFRPMSWEGKETIADSMTLDVSKRLCPDRKKTDQDPCEKKAKVGLFKDCIAWVIRKHWDEVKYCYAKELAADHSLQGKIVATMVISEDGTIRKASIVHIDESLLNHHLEECFIDNIKRWRFPPPGGGGIVVVTYPFTLLPAP